MARYKIKYVTHKIGRPSYSIVDSTTNRTVPDCNCIYHIDAINLCGEMNERDVMQAYRSNMANKFVTLVKLLQYGYILEYTGTVYRCLVCHEDTILSIIIDKDVFPCCTTCKNKILKDWNDR